jgi:signal transduction histidine kinase
LPTPWAGVGPRRERFERDPRTKIVKRMARSGLAPERRANRLWAQVRSVLPAAENVGRLELVGYAAPMRYEREGDACILIIGRSPSRRSPLAPASSACFCNGCLNVSETVGMFKLFTELIAFHIDANDRLASSEDTLADERKTAELREQFVAVLGHDLRNPLASIEAGAQLLMRRTLDDRSKEIVAMMQTAWRG